MNHRYQSYSKYSSTSVNSMGYGDGEVNGRSPQPSLANGHSDARSFKDRLKTINTAMSWIRDELEELKESDRTLMEIFKQLEGDVSDLSESVSSWRLSGSYIKDGRPMSYSDLDGTAVRPLSGSHYDQVSITHSLGTSSQNSLESTLTSSKEEVSLKTSSGSDSLLVPEADTASSSNSPVLSAAHTSSPLTSSAGLTRRTSAVTSSGQHTKRQTSASPQLKASVSLNKISNTPGISRVQDDTSSNISRNSSIDSGIQFAEAESGCTNGVDGPSNSNHHSPSSLNTTTHTKTQTQTQKTPSPAAAPAPADSRSSKTDSVSFADDIFSMLGFQS